MRTWSHRHGSASVCEREVNEASFPKGPRWGSTAAYWEVSACEAFTQASRLLLCDYVMDSKTEKLNMTYHETGSADIVLPGCHGANRILWHFVALPVGLNQFYLQKRTQIVDFYWISMSGQQVLGEMANI